LIRVKTAEPKRSYEAPRAAEHSRSECEEVYISQEYIEGGRINKNDIKQLVEILRALAFLHNKGIYVVNSAGQAAGYILAGYDFHTNGWLGFDREDPAAVPSDFDSYTSLFNSDWTGFSK